MIVREVVISTILNPTPQQVSFPVVPIDFHAEINAENEFYILDIEGLDVEDMEYNQTAYLADAEGNYLSSGDVLYRGRQLVFHLGMNPAATGVTYEQLRNRIYRLIHSSPFTGVSVRFNGTDSNNASADCAVVGQVKAVEFDRFSPNPTAKLTIDCPNDSAFRSITTYSVTLDTPLVNSLTFTDDKSTAGHGCEVVVTAQAAKTTGNIWFAGNFALDCEMLPGDGLEIDDVITVTHAYRSKVVKLERSNTTIYIAEAIVPQSVWPLIYPGENAWGKDSALVWTEITYRASYWSI
jgi:hypothetical protein